MFDIRLISEPKKGKIRTRNKWRAVCVASALLFADMQRTGEKKTPVELPVKRSSPGWGFGAG
jgi:hypothetical protein